MRCLPRAILIVLRMLHYRGEDRTGMVHRASIMFVVWEDICWISPCV